MATWEYRVETITTTYRNDDDGDAMISNAGAIEKVLTDLGDEGWELVAFLPPPPNEYCGNYSRGNFEIPSIYHAIFKRPEEPEDAHMRRVAQGKLPL
jgi:hypothetical protein